MSKEFTVLTEDVPLIADANNENNESDNAHNDDSNCLNSFHMLSRFCFNFRCKVKERLTNRLLSDGKFREREENILRERNNSFKEKSQTMSGVTFGMNSVPAYPVRRKLCSWKLAMRSAMRTLRQKYQRKTTPTTMNVRLTTAKTFNIEH